MSRKGIPNKITSSARELAEKMGVDPLNILLLFAKGDWAALGYKEETRITQDGDNGTKYEYHIEPNVRMKAAESACRYIYPTQKAVEITSPDDGGLRIVIEDFSKSK